MSRARRVALFSHDSQGLGHIRRNIEITAAIGRADAGSQTLLIRGDKSVLASSTQRVG